jgi:hypothetical protein
MCHVHFVTSFPYFLVHNYDSNISCLEESGVCGTVVLQGHLVLLELRTQNINLINFVMSSLPVLTVPHLPEVTMAQLTEKLYL